MFSRLARLDLAGKHAGHGPYPQPLHRVDPPPGAFSRSSSPASIDGVSPRVSVRLPAAMPSAASSTALQLEDTAQLRAGKQTVI